MASIDPTCNHDAPRQRANTNHNVQNITVLLQLQNRVDYRGGIGIDCPLSVPLVHFYDNHFEIIDPTHANVDTPPLTNVHGNTIIIVLFSAISE